MAYQYKGVCYGDPTSLLTAMASDMSGVSISTDGNPVYYQTAVQGEQLVTSSTTGFSVTVTPQLHPCQLVTMEDAAVFLSGLPLSLMSRSHALLIQGVNMTIESVYLTIALLGAAAIIFWRC